MSSFEPKKVSGQSMITRSNNKVAHLLGEAKKYDIAHATKGALSIGKGQIYLVLYEYYVGSYQANIS